MLYVALYRLKILAGSPLTLLLMLLAPTIGLLGISAVASPGQSALPVAVVDQDRSEYSRLLVERLQARAILRVTLPAEAEAIRLVQTRRLEAALIIEPGLQEALLAGQSEGRIRVVKSPASMAAELVGEYLASEVVRLQANTLAAQQVVAAYEARGQGRDGLWQEAWAYADSFWEPEPLMQIEYREMQAGQPLSSLEPPSIPLTLYGLLASLVLFNALLTAGSLIDERRSGVLLRLRTTHIGPGRYLAGSALATALIGTLTLTAALVGLDHSPALVEAALLAAYLVASTGAALAAGALLRTRFELQMTAPLLTLFTGLVGGGGAVLATLSRRFATLALLTPQGWLLEGLRSQSAGGSPWLSAAVLASVGLLLGALAWWSVAGRLRLG